MFYFFSVFFNEFLFLMVCVCSVVVQGVFVVMCFSTFFSMSCGFSTVCVFSAVALSCCFNDFVRVCSMTVFVDDLDLLCFGHVYHELYR